MVQFFANFLLRPGSDPADPGVRAAAGKRSGILGIVANAVLFLAKLGIGILSGSVAITADAMNNLSDAATSVVTLLGFRLAQLPADEEHPYGHARYEYLSGLAVAAMILLIGFELARSSVEKILHPGEVVFSWALVAVLALSIGVKLLLAGVNRHVGDAIRSTALQAAAQDSRNDCIATLAVLLSALVARLTSWHIDGFAGLGVAVFILYSGATLAKETVSPLLGEGADPELQKQIIAVLSSDEKVLGYHDLMVHDYGPGRRFASVHVEMDRNEDPMLCHTVIDDLERKCLELHRVHLVIHYDPIVTDDAELDEMRREVALVLESIDGRITFHDFRMVRGEQHTNLIFDMILPPDMAGREQQVKRQLDTAINLTGGKYYTVITFDEAAFNSAFLWKEAKK